MARRALLIINPISGTHHDKAGLPALARRVLAPLGWQIDDVFTKGSGDATTLARQAAAQGYEAVFTAGGDGTVNEAATALCHTSTALGIIPCGSGNGLARHLGIPVDVEQGIATLAQDYQLAIDYADINDGTARFFCTMGVGYDAAVSHNFAAKGRRGLLTYLQSAIETFVKYHPAQYTITTPEGILTEKAFLVAVCNASQYGNNAYIAPAASVRDGLLDVTIIHAGNQITRALSGLDLMSGTIGTSHRVDTIQAPEVTITRPAGTPLHLDGAPTNGLPSTLHIVCRHAALNVFASPGKEPFKPLVTPMKALAADLSLRLKKLLK